MAEAKNNPPQRNNQTETTHNPPKQEQPNESHEDLSLIGTRTGKCDICKTTKKILLLSYGFSLCQDCVNICTLLLEQIQQNQTHPPKKTRAAKQKTHPQKLTITGGQTP
ncbi:MAG: hypothetical protein M1490_01880 [Candidatus Bathyarchaeota archaeon]|nr:hypothetical protein [Candidatus Bathyarchaeota archaeon]